MKLFLKLATPLFHIYNKFAKKNPKAIFFYPHTNCLVDGYDMLNGESSNVLCLLNSVMNDKRFNDYDLFVLYYHKEKIKVYQDYVLSFNPKRIHFVFFRDELKKAVSIAKSFTVFTDSDYTRIQYRTRSQRIVCLNYFGGLIKNEFYRLEKCGGFKKMLAEQKEMYRLYDYHLSISDICSKFIALDNCHYYPHFLSLGFPRNDIFFQDCSDLRKQIEKLVEFKVDKVIVYVPTHRDYENPNRLFFNSNTNTKRSIWGHVSKNNLAELENTLAETGTLVIAKVHPIQEAYTTVVSKNVSQHVILFSELTKKIKTSLNPLLSISDAIITDYTTTVYDFLYVNRPIIYYFYDIEQYRATRGFFIEPIESVCAGHIVYDTNELAKAIKDVVKGVDPFKEKRLFLQELFIKNLDGKSCERIKKFFFENN